MFCPHCKSEYIDGISRCPECAVALLKALPPEPEPEFVDYQEVLATYSPADVAFIKSLFDADKIVYFFKGENFMYVRPLADPVRLMVRTDQVNRATELLKHVDLTVTGISMETDDE